MDLKNIIETYDGENFDTSNKDYKGVLYVCLEGGVDGKGRGAWGNEFAIMTFNSEFFCFYLLPNTLLRTPKHTDILFKMHLPYEDIIKLKISKFLIWRNLKIKLFDENDKKVKIKVVFSTKTIGIKSQKENVEALLNFIKDNIQI